MAEMTDKEANSQFNQMSKAIRDNDVEKLSSIMDMQPPEVEVTTEAEVPALEPEVQDDSVAPDDNSGKTDDDTSEVTPPIKAEDADKKEEAKREPSEMDKLKEQLDRVSKENHALRSQAGRVPHVQRKIKELDKKLEELTAKHASPSSQPSAKIQPRVQELLKGIKDTDPDLADAIAAAIAEATNGVTDELATKERENLTFLRSQEVQTYQDAEATRLMDMYPNAPEVFASPTWAAWKSEQPAGIVRLAESDSADEVAFAFEKYAENMLAKYPELSKVKDEVKEETPPAKDEAVERAKQVEAERLRKKETSVNIGNPNAPGKVGLPDDPEALFKKFSEEIRKERTG